MCPPAGRFDGSDGSRFGARASLWVHQLESDSEPLPAVTGTSPGPARVLDVDRNSLIYIGGLGAHGEVSLAEGHLCVCVQVMSVCVCGQSPSALRSSTFQGCLGEASWNERNVGLWNYNSREGECGGCFSRYKSTVTGLRPRGHNHPSVSVSPQTEETSFHFDGSGFSLVQKSLRATSTSIVLLFKTLSPGGLLLYLASNNTV